MIKDFLFSIVFIFQRKKKYINDIYIYTFIEKQTRYFHFHNRKHFLFFRIKLFSVAKRSFYAEYREKEGRLTIPLCSYTGITCDITSMSFPFAKTSLPFASVSGIPAEHSGFRDTNTSACRGVGERRRRGGRWWTKGVAVAFDSIFAATGTTSTNR